MIFIFLIMFSWRRSNSFNMVCDVMLYKLKVVWELFEFSELITVWSFVSWNLLLKRRKNLILDFQSILVVSQITSKDSWTTVQIERDWRSTGIKTDSNITRNSISVNRIKRGNLVKVPFKIKRDDSFLVALTLLKVKQRLHSRIRLCKEAGGMIVTKRWTGNLILDQSSNSLAYKHGKFMNFMSASKHAALGFTVTELREHFHLTREIQLILKKNQWISYTQMNQISKIITGVQAKLAILTRYEGYNSQLLKTIDKWSYKLLMHIYIVNQLIKKKQSKIAGVDSASLGLVVSSEEKITLVRRLKNWKTTKPNFVRKIEITKSELTKKQFLRVSILYDRAVQLLWFTLYDPIIEEHSDAYSFGFRKGRNYVQAIGHLQKNLQLMGNSQIFIWNISIKECFSRSSHDWLLRHFPCIEEHKAVLSNWLKSGIVELPQFKFESYPLFFERRSQKNNVSFLLLNLILNGIQRILDESLAILFRRIPYTKSSILLRGEKIRKEFEVCTTMVRYANSVVIVSKSRRLLSMIKSKILIFLNNRGLQIQTLNPKIICFVASQSFHFLGYTFRRLIQTRYVRHKTLCKVRKKLQLLTNVPKLHVYPSIKSLRVIRRKLTLMFRANLNSTAFELIYKLNVLLCEWYNYFRFSDCLGTWNSIRFTLWFLAKRWSIRKHPKVSHRWLMRHYFLARELTLRHKLTETQKTVLGRFLQGIVLDRWHFYGLSLYSNMGESCKIPKINLLIRGRDCSKIFCATIFVPSKNFLKLGYYAQKERWLVEIQKLNRGKINKNLFFNFVKKC